MDSEAQLFNVDLETRPLMIHGNGPSKRHLNHLGNYLPKAWNEVDQCTSCWEDVVDFEVRSSSLLQNTLNQTSNPVLTKLVKNESVDSDYMSRLATIRDSSRLESDDSIVI